MGLFRKSAIGLDISDRSIEAILVRKKAGVSELVSYGRVVIPAGIVVNGYVERRNDLIQIIRKLLADGMNPPLPKGTKRIMLSIPESRVFSHVFQVPRIADISELEKTLAFEADAFFPYGHDDMVGVQAITAKKPDTKDIFYSAVHKETLKSYLNMFHQAGLDLVVVEAESSAIARALLQPDERSPVVIVDIGARVTDLTIVDRNGPQFSETLNIAGDVFTGILTGRLNIPFEEAEALKKENGITGKMATEIEDAIKAELGKLAGDIIEAIAFFEKRSGRVIEKVLLAGGSSLMPGLMEHLEERLVTPEKDIDVALGDPWFGLKMKQSDAEGSLSNRGILMATAIGLGLRGAGVKKFQDINFLDNAHELIGQVTEKKRRKKGRGIAGYPPWLIALVGFLFFIATALGTWYISFRFYVQKAVIAPLENGAGGTARGNGIINLEVSATVGNAFSVEKRQLKGVFIDIVKTASGVFAHDGTEAEGKASGLVELVNESSNGQTLVATTRLLSEQGVLFRLAERVFVPAGERVSAKVEADRAGAEGDVPPSRFTIPGLSSAAQKLIYAESSAPMKGGLRFEGPALTREEYDAAVSKLRAEAELGLLGALREKAGEEFLIDKALMKVEEAEVLRGPTVGEPTGDYELELSSRASVLAISNEEVAALLESDLQGRAPDGAEGARIGRVELTVVSYDEASGTAEVSLRAIAIP